MSRSVPTDVKYLQPAVLVDKFQKIVDGLGEQTGPALQWLAEKEDDTKFREMTKGYTDGIPTINQSWSDFACGLAFIASRANAGKSTLLTNLQHGLITLNKEVIIVDISLDDYPKKRFQQHVASMSGLRYRHISNPATIPERLRPNWEEAKETFFKWIKEEKLVPLESTERNVDDRDIEIRDFQTICYLMKKYRNDYPNHHIIFFIDAWNNISVDNAPKGSEIERGNYVLRALKNTSEDCMIRCVISAHIRKTLEKQISVQDIKGTSNIEYDAVSIFLLRNEYREGTLAEPLMYDSGEFDLPILSLQHVKTKVSECDRPLYYPANISSCQIITPHPLEYKSIDEVARGKRK